MVDRRAWRRHAPPATCGVEHPQRKWRDISSIGVIDTCLAIWFEAAERRTTLNTFIFEEGGSYYLLAANLLIVSVSDLMEKGLSSACVG